MIQDMLNRRVIRPSTSPWVSLIVLVRKKDGSLRLCVDYRRPNARTERYSFPLPRIDTTLDALHDAKRFSTLDLALGYRQVEVRPADRQKTAFIVPSGFYEFKTMPFGLANAPAIFQRLIQRVLQDLVPSQCLIYLDDIIVHAPKIDEHNSRLKNVCERLRMAGLKLKPTKCVLLKQEVSFLGQLITPAGVKTDGTKVNQVADWPVPRSVSKVRSFMGLASYYRKFVPYFAKIASPLLQPTEEGRTFVWSAECHAAFNTLKDRLSSPPILAFPDFSPSAGPSILDTDASDLAIGAALSKRSANGEAVIAYAGRGLDKRERRYCTTCREMIALVYFHKHFRPYLLGKPFKVRTDHQALQWLRNFREPEGQVARWLDYLQDYDFDCIYRPGSRHANADALSRFPTETVNAVLFTQSVGATWAHYQLNDPYISNIYRRQLGGNRKPTSREREGRFPEERCLWSQWTNLRVVDGVLHLYDRAKRTYRLIVPSDKVSNVVREIHVELGHAGRRRTEAAVRQRFWWPKLHGDVVRNCANCNICARTRAPTVAPRAPLQTVATVGPNHRVGVDVMEASTITLFENEWVARFGTSVELHSDQGAAFGSRLLEEEELHDIRLEVNALRYQHAAENSSNLLNHPVRFPVHKVEDIQLLNVKPEDDDTYPLLVNYLSKLGGKSVSDGIGNLMRSTMTEDLAGSANWRGVNNRFSLASTLFTSAIVGMLVFEQMTVVTETVMKHQYVGVSQAAVEKNTAVDTEFTEPSHERKKTDERSGRRSDD
ncbi:uncharacterized protein DEA37_0009615 [Paragonimus westermani]|uniref:Reverse transcriptase domain-containing protein n=1 Tax=Paragonimus westermani TaxID=34504 RepID=A0A5J4NUL8_9TREM|nr:uncharacterized protein DEA37_0009615 [Paragonimus westermani]